MTYKIHPVKDAHTIKQFYQVAEKIYKDDPVWVAPLELEIEAIFNPDNNEWHEEGEATRWILTDESDEAIARVAIFHHPKLAGTSGINTGGIGFFECINDKDAAHMIFDHAVKWLKERKVELMLGPVNFGSNDKYWGLLVEGFTHPSFGMNYNPEYYRELFESYGFKLFYEQISKHLDISSPMPERFVKIAKWVSKKPGIEFRHVRKENIMDFGNDFMEIYNDAWKFHENYSELKAPQIKKIVDDLKDVLVEEITVFAYVNGEPAGMIVAIPDINQIIKPRKGKLSLIQKLLFLWRRRNSFAWYRKKGILTRGRVVIIGVRPKFQKYGLESGLAMFPMETARKMGFTEMELSWVGDFNPMSRSLQDASGSSEGKKHVTYRYFFDESKNLGRSEILKADHRGEVSKSL